MCKNVVTTMNKTFQAQAVKFGLLYDIVDIYLKISGYIKFKFQIKNCKPITSNLQSNKNKHTERNKH